MCDASKGRPGKAGDGADIRIYTKGECDSMGGIYHGNGECTKPEGGSWSWDCRGLNATAATSAPVSSGGSVGGLVSSIAATVAAPMGAGSSRMNWPMIGAGLVGAYAVYRLIRSRD